MSVPTLNPRFRLGVAGDLYRRAIHPRLLLGPQDVAIIQRQISGGVGLKIMRHLRRCIKPLLEADTDQALDERFDLYLHHLFDIAMVGVLDENAKALELTQRFINYLPRCPRAQGPGRFGDFFVFGSHLPNVPLAYDLIAPRLSQAQRRRFASWAARRGVRQTLKALLPHYYKQSGANTGLVCMCSALQTALAIQGEPGAPDLSNDIQSMIHCLEATLHTAINPDGFPEEDLGYGTAVMSCLTLVLEPLRRAGWFDVYRRCPHYARFGRAALAFLLPWGHDLVKTGDHPPDFRDRTFVLARQASQTRDRTLLWLLGTLSNDSFLGGRPAGNFLADVQVRPDLRLIADATALTVLEDLRPRPVNPVRGRIPTQFKDSARGLISFRSGWDPDATLLVFDASQRNRSTQGHWHDSGCHFSLHALGDYFAIKNGRYGIEQDQQNVVLVRGKSGRSTRGQWVASAYHGHLLDYQPHPFCDFAAADNSHQSNCHWSARAIGLVKGSEMPAYVWTVEDVNDANNYSQFWWTLHTLPGNKIHLRRRGASIQGCRRGNYLDIHLLLPRLGTMPKPHDLTMAQDVTRTSSYEYLRRSFRKHLAQFDSPQGYLPVIQRPRVVGKVRGYNGRFLSLMLPRRRGEPPAVVRQLPAVDNTLAVSITCGSVRDTLIWAYEHHLLEAGPVWARGQWVVVRQAVAGGRVLHYALGHGTELKVAGRTLSLP